VAAVSLVTTADGSHSLFLSELGEHYHSVHGAVQESTHVFLNAGLLQLSADKDIRILEIGFGTGLNAFLTCLQAEKSERKIIYESLEAFPLSEEITTKLNYARSEKEQLLFDRIHSCSWNSLQHITDNFSIIKHQTKLESVQLEENFDLVYFDAFAPDAQPELWTEEIFSKLSNLMQKGALLVTYCAKGYVRRNMIAAGLTVDRIPGPPGKRQMMRATKV
jgi:tRNA U34 5-methylaminomethyl-2-thiouridine-forming methyltransferase MnmC